MVRRFATEVMSSPSRESEYVIALVVSVVRSLLLSGVDPNVGNEDGLTALHQVGRLLHGSGLTK